MVNPGLWGTVLAVQANFYQVRLGTLQVNPALISCQGLGEVVCPKRPRKEKIRSVGQLSTDQALTLALTPEHLFPSTTLLCTRRARLKKIGQQVMVGDWVRIEEPDWEGGRGAIAAVAPRQSQLDRPPVANANQILLVFSLAEPDLDPHQLSRFLVQAETTGIEIALVLNKRDLVTASVAESWGERLQRWGYSAVVTSVQTQDPWLPLGDMLRDRVTIISGPSGVGKSSLINGLIPAAHLRTGTVSGKLGRGRHTTRHVELFELPTGGLLADTPGFNQPDIHCAPEELGYYFPEVCDRIAIAPCQFADCLHQGEPGCTVGEDWERYDDYLALLEDCLAQSQQRHDTSDRDTTLKTKVGEAGQVYHEPRLQAKKYRRLSRRSRHQSLQELRYELTDTMENLEAKEDEGWDNF
ncbi:small ribosomal subunit biogenesis GTPase RsgA [Leptolyngbya sp. PCC 6406]|uniref:small ribosomal subunit biogenesis GTPase RsgA n=1 Tax=Leptolyngbya sp. PCC 6406 TaxID=1173264 RepID=UPI0002ABC256|nr:small ribosomal subunit biogenesis GTPase RsgA [Leptolyngbya sp. PCC 6406]